MKNYLQIPKNLQQSIKSDFMIMEKNEYKQKKLN